MFQAGLSLSLNRAGLLPAGVGLEPPPEAAPESLDSPSFGGHQSQPLHRPRHSEGPGGSVLEGGGVLRAGQGRDGGARALGRLPEEGCKCNSDSLSNQPIAVNPPQDLDYY